MLENRSGDGILVLDLTELVITTQRRLLLLSDIPLGIDLVTKLSLNNILGFTEPTLDVYELPASVEFSINNPDHYEYLQTVLEHYTTILRGKILRTGLGLQSVKGLHGWLGLSILLKVDNHF